MSRILYLDFDGVLHHEAVYWHPKRGIYITPGHALFEWMPILEKLMAPHPDVRIVLSTSWVRAKNFDFSKNKLCPALRERVIGATFHRRWMSRYEFAQTPRGVQVARDVSRRAPQAWFAIDDDDWGWPAWCRHQLIRTNGETGLGDPMIQEAIRRTLSTL